MKLSEKSTLEIQELMKRYPKARSALIPALHIAQDEIGYLPHSIQEEIASLFSIDISEVKSLISFYDMFSDEPMGKKQIYLCKNLSCMLRGADAICKKMKELLKDEKEYTLHLSECLGACDKAPMMIMGEEVVGPLSDAIIEEIFSEEIFSRERSHE